jgi:hypothetical protein
VLKSLTEYRDAQATGLKKEFLWGVNDGTPVPAMFRNEIGNNIGLFCE